MNNSKIDRKDGKYAEIINQIAEHIYRDDIDNSQRRSKVVFPDGNEREIDLLVKLKNGDEIVFEVRDRKGNQGVDWVDQVIGKYQKTNFKTVWICTFGDCDLTKDAIRSLKYNNIGWRNISINSDEEIPNMPIILIDAIKVVYDELVLTINENEYRELMVEGIDENGNSISISLKQQMLEEISNIVKNDFDKFLNSNYINYETTIDIPGINNNLNSSTLRIKMVLPLMHYTLCDYFSEKYDISNNNEEEYLLATRNKSVFIADDCIVFNSTYLSYLRENGYIVSNHFLINIKAIPKKYRLKNVIKIIDVDGNSHYKVIKVIGYKEEIPIKINDNV